MGMEVNYSRDRGDQYDSLNRALEATDGREIRLRLQPQLFSTNNAGRKLYTGWRGVYWNVTCETRRDAVQVRDAMATFFRQLESFGVDAVKQWLDKLDAMAVESAKQTDAVGSGDGDDAADLDT